MSQQTIDVYANPTPTLVDTEQRTVDASAWDPFAEAGIDVSDDEAPDFARCLTCGSHVTDAFRRVFGIGASDCVAQCPDCATTREIEGGPEE